MLTDRGQLSLKYGIDLRRLALVLQMYRLLYHGNVLRAQIRIEGSAES